MLKKSLRRIMGFSSALPDALDFLVVGEMHGSEQNALVIQEFLRVLLAKRRHCAVAFEWALTRSEREALRVYLRGGNAPSKLSAFFLDSDGRFTIRHIALLKWIRAYNCVHRRQIDVHTFDDPRGGGDEHSMAKSLSAYKKAHERTSVLVETGNMHAKSIGVKRDAMFAPMAALLKNKYSVFSVFLSYKSGKISVGRKEKNVTEASSQQKDSQMLFYDAMVTISRSVPSGRLKSLTELWDMLS